MRVGGWGANPADISLITLIEYADFIAVGLYTWSVSVVEKSLDSTLDQYVRTTDPSSRTLVGD